MPFEVIPTRISGPLLLQPTVFPDSRGFFCETYRENQLAEVGVSDAFVQDNHSRSGYGVIRGMHFQIGDGCAKLVRCGRGSIVDIVVDLRRSSPTYGEWEAHELTDETMRMLYVPVGFGHGFAVTSEIADVLYKQSAYYAGEVERGISFLDPAIGIDWPIPDADRVFSDRDADALTLAQFADGGELPDW